MPSIEIRIDPSRGWGWHRALAAHLTDTLAANVRFATGATRKRRGALPYVLAIEGMGGRVPHPAFVTWDGVPVDAAHDKTRAEVVVDVAACAIPKGERDKSVRMLIPLFDGVPGEDRMWLALMGGRAPRLSLYDSSCRGVLDIGQPANEAPHALGLAGGAVVVRLIEGIAAALSGRLAATTYGAASPGAPVDAVTLGTAAARLIMRKAITKLRRKIETPWGGEEWATLYAVRPADMEWPSGSIVDDKAGGSALREAELDPADWRLLPEDGQRYYADPFLFAHGGRVHLFVEELPHATNRGIISVTELGADGRAAGTPRPVLDTGHHLSYPQVFARDGEIWMLPEQHKSGSLILYRAVNFPDRWELAATLVHEPLHDATIFEHHGLMWIAATHEGPLFETGRGRAAAFRWGSSWDSLVFFKAPSLLGPWSRHSSGPVLIDAACARSGGPVLTSSDGTKVRPVQDCVKGYGTALGFARIDRLDADGSANGAYRQSLIGRMRFPARSAIAGPHTLSRLETGGLRIEAIDAFGRRQSIKSAVSV